MVKRRIIYESEDEENDADQMKKPRTVPDNALAGTRRSERSGKGNGGRLAQMKQIERIQTETTKRPSRIDNATQGEDVNPMAPSFRDVDEISRRTGSDGAVVSKTHRQPPTQSHSQLRPEFLQAAPGEQFGFRLPDTAFQTQNDTRAPSRNKFTGVSSANSSTSQPPSSRGSSLFSAGGALGTTPATSRAPSVCSSTGDWRLGQREETQPSSTSRVSNGGNPPDVRDPTRLQRTASFYNAPLSMNCTGHSISAAPELDHPIDENSPSDDDRIAEEALHRREDDERSARISPLQENSRRPFQEPVNDDNDHSDEENDTAEQNDDRTPVQTHSQPRDHAAATYHRRYHTPDNTTTRLPVSPAPSRAARLPVEPAPRRPTSLPAQPSEGVVSIYRRRNRAPRLPSNSQLLAIRQQQAGSVARNTTAQAANADDCQDRPTDAPVGPVVERAEPWQLQYYDPPTRDVIERAKQFSHCDAASINPFPVRASFNAKAVEYINEATSERRDRGLVISDGWWPQHASNITRLLWEDLGNWRSTLRKKARMFVTQRYQWDPENRRERNIEIAKNLLGGGGLFLRDGTDDEGHINNLAHPALSGLLIDFFYTSPFSVGKLFPEVFSGEVPRVTVAIAATALKVVLDEIAAGQAEVNFRVNVYSPVFTEILGLMSKCDTNTIHRAKTKALRERWAELGSNGMVQETTGGCGFDVCFD